MVVATTVALSFISFWRAAAVVLSDLVLSAFYAGGIAEHANLDMRAEITPETVHARPGCLLVTVRDYNHMVHPHNVLLKTNLRRRRRG